MSERRERGREREREGGRKRETEGERRREREKEREAETGREGGRENAPLKPIKGMKKLERGSTDILIDNAKIALVRCKDNKVVTVLSSNYGLNPTAKTKRYTKERKVESILSNLDAIKKQHRNGRG